MRDSTLIVSTDRPASLSHQRSAILAEDDDQKLVLTVARLARRNGSKLHASSTKRRRNEGSPSSQTPPFELTPERIGFDMSRPSHSAVIAGFTDDQAMRLAGVSPYQLRYWTRQHFFVPSIEVPVDDNAPPVRLYSFRDLVCLKIINFLRNEAGISLQLLRVVKKKLSHLGDDLWAKTTLYVLGRRVVFDNPETGKREDVASGQGVLQIPLIVVSGNMEEAVRAMRRRPEAERGRIDTKRSGSKNPVVAGTRISVKSIKDFAEAGYTVEGIIEQYPSLTDADVRAALEYKFAA